MVRRTAAALAVAFGLVLVPVAPAGAEHCSGKATPPSQYNGRGSKVTYLGWSVHTGSPADRFAGVHYADGYIYADGNSNKVTYRSFTPWWPYYVDVKIVVGQGGVEQACVHPGI